MEWGEDILTLVVGFPNLSHSLTSTSVLCFNLTRGKYRSEIMDIFVICLSALVTFFAVLKLFPKPKCSVCGSRHFIKSPCFICGKNVCSKCSEDLGDIGQCCPETIHENILSAAENQSNVKIYSSNYRGKVPLPKYSLMIKTKFYREKNTAEKALRFIAAMNGGEVIQQVEFHKETGQEGNYQFATWQAKGVI